MNPGIERVKIDKRTNLAEKTREKNQTKLGRKSGKPTKSMYDEHKAKIKKLHDLGVTKTKIIEHIGIGTAQSLGVYIKKKFSKDNKTKKEKNHKTQEQVPKDKNYGNLDLQLMRPTLDTKSKKRRKRLRKK